jgi:hypothetical protein
MSPNDRVAQLCPQTPGSLFIVFHDSQSRGGGILTRLHTGSFIDIELLSNQETMPSKVAEK